MPKKKTGSASYDSVKEFGGERYWKEKKVAPEIMGTNLYYRQTPGGACKIRACYDLDIKHIGVVRWSGNTWKVGKLKSQGLANAIGQHITDWYQKVA